MPDDVLQLAAAVPAEARERRARGTVRRDDGSEEQLPPAAVLVLRADLAAPETGVSVVGYSAAGEPAGDSWYITPDEAQACLARDYGGQLGPWRPLAQGDDPMALVRGGPAPGPPEAGPPGARA